MVLIGINGNVKENIKTNHLSIKVKSARFPNVVKTSSKKWEDESLTAVLKSWETHELVVWSLYDIDIFIFY